MRQSSRASWANRFRRGRSRSLTRSRGTGGRRRRSKTIPFGLCKTPFQGTGSFFCSCLIRDLLLIGTVRKEIITNEPIHAGRLGFHFLVPGNQPGQGGLTSPISLLQRQK